MSTDLEIYDTTLRDGTQGADVSVSLADKLALSEALDRLGVDYIEGGWPSSNPKDEAYFAAVRRLDLRHAKVAAFGMTRRAKVSAAEDENLRKLVAAQADVITIFGKTWDLHVTDALRVPFADNLAMIADSVRFLREATGRPVFYDAEHCFDGYRSNPAYALDTMAAAHAAGAERIILCDTNGGSLPEQVTAVVAAVRRHLPAARLGIHVHNDGGLAVANTLAAIAAGCTHVQGTINGVGERCGNVDLTTVIANCELKLGRRCLPDGHLARLTELSRLVWERLNIHGPVNQPYVGRASFAHKGGVHVSAVQRNAATYEHVAPEAVGNTRVILVSELAGRASVEAKLASRYPQLKDAKVMARVLALVQERENEGYAYEAADASFDLLVRSVIGERAPLFNLHSYRVISHGRPAERAPRGEGDLVRADDPVEATVHLTIGGSEVRAVDVGHGPVDALWRVLAKALGQHHAAIAGLHLTDYKVRVVDSADGTAAKVRVLIEFSSAGRTFGTVGVNENIIAASWNALVEGIEYAVDLHTAMAADGARRAAQPG